MISLGCVLFSVVYLPPQGSHRIQHHSNSQQQRFAELAGQVSAAQRMGHVLLCGNLNFNALVSSTGSEGLTAGSTSLLDFCEVCNLTLLTGRLPQAGDIPATCAIICCACAY